MPLGRRAEGSVLTADQTSSVCKRDIFIPAGSCTMFCTLSPTCVTRYGEIQSVVDNPHVVTRGSSWLVSATAPGQSFPGPGGQPCCRSHHRTGQSCSKYTLPAAPSKARVSIARISVSCHRLEAHCWAILPCSTKCMPKNIQQVTHQLFIFPGSFSAR